MLPRATLDTLPIREATVIATTSTTATAITSEIVIFEKGTEGMITTTVSRHTETRAIEILATCEIHEMHEIHTTVRGIETIEMFATGIFATLEIFAMFESVIRVTSVVPVICETPEICEIHVKGAMGEIAGIHTHQDDQTIAGPNRAPRTVPRAVLTTVLTAKPHLQLCQRRSWSSGRE